MSDKRLAEIGLVILVAMLLTLAPLTALATETRHWVVDSAAELLKGRGQGVAVTEDGRLTPAAGWRQAVELEEPVVVAGAVERDGALLVGTGHPARLYRIRRGSKELLAELPGEQVTAVMARDDGQVLVATIAPGVLLGWRKGKLVELGRLGEGGFWDLAELGGEVIAAAGPPATLYRVTERGLERWLELPDAHARCLAVAGGRLAIGTSGKGLILSADPSGGVALLADSRFTEISDLAAAADGSLWAAAVVGEPSAPAKAGESKTSAKQGQGRSEVAAASLDLPKIDGKTATSELLRLTPEGALLRVHRFAKQVATTVAADGKGVLVGTGFEGEVWRFVASGGARLATLDAVQATVLLDGGRAVLTQGPAAVRLRQTTPAREARYRIDAATFERPVRFGAFAADPPGDGVRLRFRSGASAKPDSSWLPWSEWLPASGRVPLPAARSLQWEVELPAGGAVERVDVAYREVNLAPRIEALEVAPPGVVYISGPPPAGPVIEVEHPDFSGIFSVLDNNGGAGSKPKQGKKMWRVGYRTVSWKANDPNEEPLRFDLELESEDGFRLAVREHLKRTELGIDTGAVPDGRYRFRVRASDELTNPGAPLTATALSHWFVVDNTPPAISLSRHGERWQVTVSDRSSPLERVEWARDGERWQGLAPEDGLLDGLEERFSFPAASGQHLVVVRAIDLQHNRATAGGREE